ncbi:hypothetical protein NEPAR08_1023 [Nematocida parisii]|nr:hypothetical protein NEPAR08_1023 [Nematocida parisii]
MSFSNNSTNIDRKEFAAEQELQEILSSSKCKTKPLKHASTEEERPARNEKSNPQIVNSSLDVKIQQEIVNCICDTITIDLEPGIVLQQLKEIWELYDTYNELTTSRRVRLFTIGINIKSNPNWNIVKGHLKKFAEQLKTEESLGTKKTWEDIEPELKILLRQYANAKLFIPRTHKAIMNDNPWSLWIKDTFIAIFLGKYSVENLRHEIKNAPRKYPLRWQNINWEASEKDIYNQLLANCPKNTQ